MPPALAQTVDAPEPPLDTAVRLITPERITFQYRLAGPFRRAGAYLLDLALISGLTIASILGASILSLGSGAGLGLALALIFIIRFGYGALCEAFLNGQTPGKRALGIRVVSVEGVPVTGAQAFLRNLLWCFDGLIPFAYLPAIISMTLTRRFQRLGDLAAGTMVIVEQRRDRDALVAVREPEVQAVLRLLPSRIDAGSELARALSDYVRSRNRFSPARREEMAAPLASQARLRFQLPDAPSADAILCALHDRIILGG